MSILTSLLLSSILGIAAFISLGVIYLIGTLVGKFLKRLDPHGHD